MDVRSRGVLHLSGVLVCFILKSVVLVVLHANFPTFLSYLKLTAVHDSELLCKFNTTATLWPHRNSDFHLLLVRLYSMIKKCLCTWWFYCNRQVQRNFLIILYQEMQILSQSMKPEIWHHAETKLYCSHENSDVTHSVSNQGYGTCSCDSSDSLLRGSCPNRSATDPRDPVSTSLLSSTFFLPQQLFSKRA